MSEKERKLKTRCYYSDYVNHMIRFYLSTPETLQMEGKRKADIEHWISVQDVWHRLGTEEKEKLEEIYRSHYKLAEGVRMYCRKTGADTLDTWVLITKVCAKIAQKRGLV